MSVNTHALNRSIAKLTFGVMRDVETKRRRDAIDSLAERDHQFQLPISGIAPADPANCKWDEVTLSFETGFPVESQGARDSDFDRPQHYFGVEIRSDPPVMVTACVVGWARTTHGMIEGARVAATALAVGSDRDVKFSGILHVTFQGWGAPIDRFDDTEGI